MPSDGNSHSPGKIHIDWRSLDTWIYIAILGMIAIVGVSGLAL
jgi:hypothetical protein